MNHANTGGRKVIQNKIAIRDRVKLNKQIDDTQGEIDATWAEIYALLGTDKAGVDAYRSELGMIESEIDGLASLTPEELWNHKADIKALEERIAMARESNLSYLSEMEAKLAELRFKGNDGRRVKNGKRGEMGSTGSSSSLF